MQSENGQRRVHSNVAVIADKEIGLLWVEFFQPPGRQLAAILIQQLVHLCTDNFLEGVDIIHLGKRAFHGVANQRAQ